MTTEQRNNLDEELMDSILEQCNPREDDGHCYYWHADAYKAMHMYSESKDKRIAELEEKLDDYAKYYMPPYKEALEKSRVLNEAAEKVIALSQWQFDSSGKGLDYGKALEAYNELKNKK